MTHILHRCLTILSVVALLVLSVTLAPRPVLAVEPDEILSDSQLEARARKISAGLRCLVCQNQSIDDSNAPLAKDLRVLVRDRLSKGDSDAAVLEFVVARYGSFVLLKPPFSIGTLLLWLTPALFLALGLLAVFRTYSRGHRPALTSSVLTPEEEARLKHILEKP